MRSHKSLRSLGLSKLAQDLGYEYQDNPPEVRSPSGGGFAVNPFRAPTPQEASDMDAYPKAGILGGLAGGAAGVLLGALAKRNPLQYGALGAGTGAAAALLRHYDQSSDPPGLSPVYTIPSGLRLGGLTGVGTGALLGKTTRLGTLPAMLAGGLTGAVGGGIVSGMV